MAFQMTFTLAALVVDQPGNVLALAAVHVGGGKDQMGPFETGAQEAAAPIEDESGSVEQDMGPVRRNPIGRR
jgi:hypothetical protein